MELCDRLVKYYNTNILDDEKTLNQVLFYSESKKHMLGKKGLTTLMRLIYNHYKGKKPTPSYIGGPLTLSSHWSDKYKKMIYIFGESHSSKMDCEKHLTKFCDSGEIINTKTNKCVSKSSPEGKEILNNIKQTEMPIEKFLEELIINTDVFIDIFFEISFYRGEEYDDINKKIGNDRIGQIVKNIGTCLEYSKRVAKKCQLARVHYFDIRKGDKIEIVNDISYFRFKLSPIFRFGLNGDQKYMLLKMLMKDKRIKNLLNGLNESSLEKYRNFWKKEIKNNFLVQKELSKTYLKEEINNFITKKTLYEAIKIRHIFTKYIPQILNEKEKDSFVDAFQKVYSVTVHPNAVIVDAYTLSRVFKVYDVQKPAFKGNIKRDQPSEAHNIILYGGNAHSKNYRQFLKSIGFVEINNIGSEEGRFDLSKPVNCLNMKNFPQPFFSLIQD